MSRGNLVIDGTQILMANLAVNDEDYTNDMEYYGGMMGLIRQVGGFINMFNPYAVYIAFDTDKSKHRLAIHPEYKAGRQIDIADDLRARFAHRHLHTTYLKTILPMLGVNVMTYPDVEADDIIANFIRKSKRFNTLISTDKDFIQLVGPNTRLYRPIPKPVMITNDNINEVLGFHKDIYLHVRTLEGDKSDNIQGVKGIGAKTALKVFDLAGSCDPLAIKDWANTECKFVYKDELIRFIDENRWDFNQSLMDLTRGPDVDLSVAIEPPERDYQGAYDFLLELKIDDFMMEEDMHRVLTCYDDLK